MSFNTAKERDLLIKIGRRCKFKRTKSFLKEEIKDGTLREIAKDLGYSEMSGFVHKFLHKLIDCNVLCPSEYSEYSKYDKYYIDESKLLDLICSLKWFKESYDYIQIFTDIYSNALGKNIDKKIYKDGMIIKTR